MDIKGLKIHRISSWLLVLFALITILLGYVSTRRWLSPYNFYITLHLVIQWVLIGLSIVHVIFSRKYMKLKPSRLIERLRSERANNTNVLRLLQLITKWGIVILAILLGLSGLTYYMWFAEIFGDFFFFSVHIDYDILLLIFIIVHVGIGFKFYLTRKKIKHWKYDMSIGLLILSLTITVLYINYPPLLGPNAVTIGRTRYSFDPAEVNTTRPDLFHNESFSVFDILVHLNSIGEINLTYHFNLSLNTHVIDSLNGEQGWWYHVYYDGGYPNEPNVHRMDHYPWKPGTHIKLYKENLVYIDEIYLSFEEEVTHLASNNGTIIIPTVTINGSSFNIEFYNISITPHNIRNDTLQNGVITALDVIMTLGDLGNITYELKWIKSFSRARYVYSYFVNKINSDEAVGRCGFLYEVGDANFKYPGPNYIFLAADERILTSPEYLRFFWGCL